MPHTGDRDSNRGYGVKSGIGTNWVVERISEDLRRGPLHLDIVHCISRSE